MIRRVFAFCAAVALSAVLAFVAPGRMSAAAPAASQLTAIDLSLYVRVGRFDLPEPTRTPRPPDSVLAQEVSAVTYNWDTDTLFVVGDGGTSVVQVTKTGALIDSMTLAPGSSPQNTDFFDPEGLAYVGERQVRHDRRARSAGRALHLRGRDDAVPKRRADGQARHVRAQHRHRGHVLRPDDRRVHRVKEAQPQGIFQTGIDFAAGTATNGSPTTENSTNLFDPALMSLSISRTCSRCRTCRR